MGTDVAGYVSGKRILKKHRSTIGNDSKKSKGRKKTQILVSQAQPLQTLRAAASVPAQVWPVPLMFPRLGVAR